jgi:serine/threonine protein kinase
MSDPIPGPLAVVSHYNLLERLEPAGPGELFRARDTRLGRTVAVRLLPRSVADPQTPQAYVQDLLALRALSHPNVTALFDAGEHEGQIFVVFEFVKGQSLRSEMDGRPLNVRRAVDLGIQMADAVADAHACGYLHAGLSLESVVVTAKGHAKIPTRALASREGFVSRSDATLQDHLSPEEAQGGTPDERSDVYSVGAVLYELLTARPPLHRGSAAPSAANHHVLRDLDEVVLKAVAPNPDNRHQSAATLASDLRRVSALLETQELPGDETVDTPTRSGVGIVLVWAAVVIAGVAAALWWWFR